MAKLYLGVRIPEKSYSSVILENIDLKKSVLNLKCEISKKIDFPSENLELIHNGNVLQNDENLFDINVFENSLIHVFKKTSKPQPYVSLRTYSDEDYRKIAELFSTVTHAQININTRINILQKVINEYPEFRKNLGAYALIRDSVLFHSLDKPEVIKKVAQNYSVICDAAEFIVKTTKREIAKSDTVYKSHLGEESFSDVTSSSEEENSQNEIARIRRISREQLAAALMIAGSSSLNSLPNIAQRNAAAVEEQQQSSSASSSSSAQFITPGPITPTLFRNALSQAILSTTSNRENPQSIQSMDIGEDNNQLITQDTSQGESTAENSSREQQSINPSRDRFALQLQLMREMGLIDENLNYNALILCDGQIDAAVNLVLTDFGRLLNMN